MLSCQFCVFCLTKFNHFMDQWSLRDIMQGVAETQAPSKVLVLSDDKKFDMSSPTRDYYEMIICIT